jgi:glycosyltransferase involved in cell wall biosynthesis
MPPARATLSVAMIVRDEAAHLGECLAGVRGWADEICVVDTGSEDGTAAIAEAAGCRVAHYVWSNNFAAARNVSLEMCTGTWIFVLDADERLSQEGWAGVRELTQGPCDRCYRFTTRNYTSDTRLADFAACPPGESEALLPAAAAHGFPGWYPSTKVRLFPRHPDARFEGAVHELVNVSLLHAGFTIENCDIPVHHYPLAKTPEQVRRKRERYIELGLAKLREQPEDAASHAELGDQYAELGDYGRAARAYREAVRLNPENASWLADLGGALYLLGRAEEAERALRLALRRDPGLAAAWRNLAVVHGDRGEWAAAAACLERAVALAAQPAAFLGDLAAALEADARHAEAAEAAAKALRLVPCGGAVLARYTSLMRRLGRETEGRAFLANLAASGEAALERAFDDPGAR